MGVVVLVKIHRLEVGSDLKYEVRKSNRFQAITFPYKGFLIRPRPSLKSVPCASFLILRQLPAGWSP